MIDDPPPISSTLETWERHLESLKKLPDNIHKHLAIQRAEDMVQELKLSRGRG